MLNVKVDEKELPNKDSDVTSLEDNSYDDKFIGYEKWFYLIRNYAKLVLSGLSFIGGVVLIVFFVCKFDDICDQYPAVLNVFLDSKMTEPLWMFAWSLFSVILVILSLALGLFNIYCGKKKKSDTAIKTSITEGISRILQEIRKLKE